MLTQDEAAPASTGPESSMHKMWRQLQANIDHEEPEVRLVTMALVAGLLSIAILLPLALMA